MSEVSSRTDEACFLSHGYLVVVIAIIIIIAIVFVPCNRVLGPMRVGFMVDSRWIPSFRKYILRPSSGPQITAVWICTCVESGLIYAMCTHSPTSWQVFVLCRWGMQWVILCLFVHKTKNSRRPVFTAELSMTCFWDFYERHDETCGCNRKGCLPHICLQATVIAMGIIGLVMEVRVLGTPFAGLDFYFWD